MNPIVTTSFPIRICGTHAILTLLCATITAFHTVVTTLHYTLNTFRKSSIVPKFLLSSVTMTGNQICLSILRIDTKSTLARRRCFARHHVIIPVPRTNGFVAHSTRPSLTPTTLPHGILGASIKGASFRIRQVLWTITFATQWKFS